jgi:hypothetical protein
MRYLLQILGLILIACIGWNQPFCDVARTVMPWAQIPPSRLSLIKARAQPAGVTPPPSKNPPSSSSNRLAPPVHR